MSRKETSLHGHNERVIPVSHQKHTKRFLNQEPEIFSSHPACREHVLYPFMKSCATLHQLSHGAHTKENIIQSTEANVRTLPIKVVLKVYLDIFDSGIRNA